MKRKTIGAALMLLMTSGAAYAGTCEDQMAAYNKHVAEDKAEASKWAPGVKEANDKFNEQMKANILKGCEPGGFFDKWMKPFETSKRSVRLIQISRAVKPATNTQDTQISCHFRNI